MAMERMVFRAVGKAHAATNLPIFRAKERTSTLKLIATLVALAAFPLAAAGAERALGCDRSCLKLTLDHYLAAVVKRGWQDPQHLDGDVLS